MVDIPKERIDVDDEVMGGVPCVRRTRIPVVTVLGALADDLSVRAVVTDYPQLDREDVRACLHYGRAAVGYWRVAPPLPSQHLATSGRRAVAVELLGHAAGVVDDPKKVLEALDLITSSVLDIAGVAPGPAREILAALWAPDAESPTAATDARQNGGTGE